MSVSNQLKNQHLMWRAGFGPAVEQLGDLDKFSPKQLYKALQKASAKRPQSLNAAGDYLNGLMMGIGEAGRQQREMDAEKRKEMQQKSREGIRNRKLYWLNELFNIKA